MKLRFSQIIVFLALLSACGNPGAERIGTPTIAATPVLGTLTVDPSKDLGPISSYVYGSNYGPWTAIPAGMLNEALNSHITALRFPGGNWGDRNDVADYQIDSFMALCRQIGAMPVFNVRLLGGTPEAAAEMVQYTNIEKKYGVVYWGIGNEPDLYYQLAATQDYDVVRFNQEWRSFAKAMKAADPTIKLFGPELSNFTGMPNQSFHALDIHGKDWMSEFLKANGDLVDVVSLHRYPFPIIEHDSTQATIEQLRQDAPKWVQIIQELRKSIHDITGRDIPIAVTEANSASTDVINGEGTPDSFYNAIWWADVLGELINQNVLMVNYWVLTTSSGGTGGHGLIATGKVRPTYYIYQMYQHFGTEKVYAASWIQNISIYAAKSPDGTLTLMVINLTDAGQHVPLQIRGKKPTSAHLWLLDASHDADDLGKQPLPVDAMLSLPAQSMALYVMGK